MVNNLDYERINSPVSKKHYCRIEMQKKSGDTRSYKVEIVDHKNLLVQLQASKSSIEDLFKDLLDEMKGLNIK